MFSIRIRIFSRCIKLMQNETKRGAPIFEPTLRAFELKELIQKFAFQTFCPQSRCAARHIRGGSEMRLRKSFSKKSLGAPLFARPHPNFYDWRTFKKIIIDTESSMAVLKTGIVYFLTTAKIL